MACSFDIQLKEEPHVYLNKARTAVEKLKGSLVGDDQAGSISVSTPIGDIKAEYAIQGNNVMHINVLDKPFFLSCDKIKMVLKEYIG
jgi:hypothetical protein